jgi:MFS family permease
MVAGRFIFGLSAGAFSVFVPSFINEITPVELKGPCGTATQILINIGILLADLMGLPLPEVNDIVDYSGGSFVVKDYWRVIIFLPVPLAILQSALLFTVFNFETPKYLLQNNRLAELTAVMGKLYASDQVQERIRLIEVKSSEEGKKSAAPSYKDTLCSPQYSTATLVGCLLAIFQQLSGINIVIFYSSTIMTSSGLSPNKITALVGGVCCLGVLPTVWLFK